MILNKRGLYFIIIICMILNSSYSGRSETRLNLNQTSGNGIQINLDTIIKEAKTGDEFQFKSTISYNGSEKTPKLIVAMNIVNLKDGAPVDPEDWSPKRTQFVSSLSDGQSAVLTWTVYTIIKGDYAVYLVVIPIPDAQDETSIAVSSSAIHLTVNPFTRLNPGGILPTAIGIPLVMILVYAWSQYYRRKTVDFN